MKLNDAIQYVAEYHAKEESLPTHCTVRCEINDLTADNPYIYANGYNQDRAFKRVIKLIKGMKS